MKNFVQPGPTITVVSPAGGLISGQGFIIGALFGISSYDVPAGSLAEIEAVGVFDLPKAGTIALTQGQPVFWDATAGDVTSVSLAHFPIGVAVLPAAASATAATVRLNGVATAASAT
jgi:predicted RecA/RadA family phage recombinase